MALSLFMHRARAREGNDDLRRRRHDAGGAALYDEADRDFSNSVVNQLSLISGVTGTVIDIGLVRLYLADLADSGGKWHPTGRIVVYSNSVLFQPSALFKQMPETDYVWHTVRLVLAPETDFKLAEERISRAVDTVYDKYRHGIEQQHAKLERAVDSQITRPQPEVRLHYSDDGLEAFVDYPAQIKHAAITDCEIVKALEDAIVREPRLAFGKAGNPKIVTKAA